MNSVHVDADCFDEVTTLILSTDPISVQKSGINNVSLALLSLVIKALPMSAELDKCYSISWNWEFVY